MRAVWIPAPYKRQQIAPFVILMLERQRQVGP